MLAVVSSGSAITHGQPDGNAHPYVGLMVAIDEDGVPQWRCSRLNQQDKRNRNGCRQNISQKEED